MLRQGKAASDVAAAHDLDGRILERWLCLLSESSGEHWKEFRLAEATTIQHVASEYQKAYEKSAQNWSSRLSNWRKRFRTETELDFALPERPSVKSEDDPLFAEIAFGEGPFDLPESARVQALRQEWKHLEKTLPSEPAMASAVIDKEEPVQQHVFIRGDHHNPGKAVTKGFPLVLANNQPDITKGSGRLKLASGSRNLIILSPRE